MSPQDAVFRSLYDPTRRAIFEQLCGEREQTFGSPTTHVGVTQPAVSKRLIVLKEAGLVSDRHEGRYSQHLTRPAGRPLAPPDARHPHPRLVHSRFENLPLYAFATRFIFVPSPIVMGLWMWKGHLLRRLFERPSVGGQPVNAKQH